MVVRVRRINHREVKAAGHLMGDRCGMKIIFGYPKVYGGLIINLYL